MRYGFRVRNQCLLSLHYYLYYVKATGTVLLFAKSFQQLIFCAFSNEFDSNDLVTLSRFDIDAYIMSIIIFGLVVIRLHLLKPVHTYVRERSL